MGRAGDGKPVYAHVQPVASTVPKAVPLNLTPTRNASAVKLSGGRSPLSQWTFQGNNLGPSSASPLPRPHSSSSVSVGMPAATPQQANPLMGTMPGAAQQAYQRVASPQ